MPRFGEEWDMIKFVHICITQYAKQQALKQQTNGTHSHTPKPVCEHKDITVL